MTLDDNIHHSQKNHCNDNCNDFSDSNDIIAPLEKFRFCCDMKPSPKSFMF